MYAWSTLHADDPHTWQPFAYSSTDLNRSTTLEKKAPWHNQQHTGWPIRRSVPSFSPTTANKAVEKNQASVDNRLLGLPGPYHWYAIGMFNTCSWGSTHRSLTDSGRGYSLECADFPCTTLWPSQLVLFTFHLRASPGLQFNQLLSIKSKCGV
jgi:hypothetical protein